MEEYFVGKLFLGDIVDSIYYHGQRSPIVQFCRRIIIAYIRIWGTLFSHELDKLNSVKRRSLLTYLPLIEIIQKTHQFEVNIVAFEVNISYGFCFKIQLKIILTAVLHVNFFIIIFYIYRIIGISATC